MIALTSSLWFFLSPGCLHRGWHVRFARTARPRHSRRFRDGRRQGDAKGFREEHVHQKALEVIVISFLLRIQWSDTGRNFIALTRQAIN